MTDHCPPPKLNGTNQIIGGIFIVAGTTIGGGMLALPIAGAKIGLVGSIFLLCALWFIMYQVALVMIKLNQGEEKTQNIALLAKKYLGRTTGIITSIIVIGFCYALLSAYISGATSIIKTQIPAHLEIALPKNHGIAILLTCIFGGILVSKMKILDLINRFFVIFKFCIFAIMIVMLCPKVTESLDTITLPAVLSGTASGWIIAIPIFLTSFGFHTNIASVMRYTPPYSHKKVIFIGSIIPLLIYIIWIVCTRVVLNHASHESLDLGQFITQLSQCTPIPLFRGLTVLFSSIAVLTSFLGVGMGLFHLIQDHLKFGCGMITHIALTLLPPLGLALFYPEGFLFALDYAAIAFTFFALLIPGLIFLKMRKIGKIHGNFLGIIGLIGTALILIGIEVMSLYLI